ncbi:MAG: hypothetical protein FD180_3529 [Planctomycetota bacterium]|nr:MAG: hypothetical protein FD180_3529 [Planctomycetota bacterium]
MMPNAVLTALMTAAALALPADAQVAEPSKNPLKMTISVVIKEEEIKGKPGKVAHKLIGSGEAAYPDGAALQFGIRLKEDQNFVIRGQGYVTAGRWEIELPPMGDNIYHGMYVCQVDFDPELQVSGLVGKIAADKRGRNNTKCEQKIGSDEAIAKETSEMNAWYKERLKTYRTIFEKVKAEYAAQTAAKNKANWQNAVLAAREQLLALDEEIAAGRKRRLNILRQDVYDTLAGAVMRLSDYGIAAYTAQLAFDGTPPTESKIGHNEEVARKAIELIEQALSGVKPPEEPKK